MTDRHFDIDLKETSFVYQQCIFTALLKMTIIFINPLFMFFGIIMFFFPIITAKELHLLKMFNKKACYE